MLENQKDIILLKKELEKDIEKSKNNALKKPNNIKVISICCLALLGFLSFHVLYIVLGGLVLAYKPYKSNDTHKNKKSALQWVAGFLSILPISIILIGTILSSIEVYEYSDDIYDYYSYPYLNIGLGLSITGELLFYAGSIISLIFILKTINNIDAIFQEKINELNNTIIPEKINELNKSE